MSHLARNRPEGELLTMPVTYSDLDVGIDGEFRELKIWVSGVKAKGYIDHGHSARVRILFEESEYELNCLPGTTLSNSNGRSNIVTNF